MVSPVMVSLSNHTRAFDSNFRAARLRFRQYAHRMSFRITGLDPEQFKPLFSLSDEELAARHIKRVVADQKPGFPCRVTLRDAQPGESLLLLNYEHLPVDSPYRSNHAIFVSESAQDRYDEVDRVPEVMLVRLLSVRSFDSSGMMLDADVLEGTRLEAAIPRFFEDPRAEYLHVHNAKRGCFSARVDRVK
jgi:uncharacterized protein DUF1203